MMFHSLLAHYNALRQTSLGAFLRDDEVAQRVALLTRGSELLKLLSVVLAPNKLCLLNPSHFMLENNF